MGDRSETVEAFRVIQRHGHDRGQVFAAGLPHSDRDVDEHFESVLFVGRGAVACGYFGLRSPSVP